jgi:hypothetical protein
MYLGAQIPSSLPQRNYNASTQGNGKSQASFAVDQTCVKVELIPGGGYVSAKPSAKGSCLAEVAEYESEYRVARTSST